jgi:hypothetical protein
MAAIPSLPNSPRTPHRRWKAGVLVLVALLAVYALALQWVTEQVSQDVENSLRDVPVLDDHTPRTN